MADNETVSNATSPRAAIKRAKRATAKRGAAAGRAVTKTARSTVKKASTRSTAQTAAIIAVSAAAAAGAVYALKRSGWIGGKESALATLNKDVKRVTADAVKSLVEKSEDVAQRAGKLAAKAEKKSRKFKLLGH